MTGKPQPTATRWLLAALAAAVALLLALTLRGLGEGPQPVSSEAAGMAADQRPGAPTSGPGGDAVAPLDLADETPPWRAAAGRDTSALPPGTVPASQVSPPPPDPSRPMPPAPVEPPNPAQHRPPLHNPGGLNGDRPERPVPR